MEYNPNQPGNYYDSGHMNQGFHYPMDPGSLVHPYYNQRQIEEQKEQINNIQALQKLEQELQYPQQPEQLENYKETTVNISEKKSSPNVEKRSEEQSLSSQSLSGQNVFSQSESEVRESKNEITNEAKSPMISQSNVDFCQDDIFEEPLTKVGKVEQAQPEQKDEEDEDSDEDFKPDDDNADEGEVKRKRKVIVRSTTCVICGKYFTNLRRLRTHKHQAHSKMLKLRKFCEWCTFSAKQMKDLLMHIKEEHDKFQMVQCSVTPCDYKTEKPSKLDRHIKAVHEKRMDFKCKKCDFITSHDISFRRHMKTKH